MRGSNIRRNTGTSALLSSLPVGEIGERMGYVQQHHFSFADVQLLFNSELFIFLIIQKRLLGSKKLLSDYSD